jgi:hypothetical protein
MKCHKHLESSPTKILAFETNYAYLPTANERKAQIQIFIQPKTNLWTA